MVNKVRRVNSLYSENKNNLSKLKTVFILNFYTLFHLHISATTGDEIYKLEYSDQINQSVFSYASH